MYAQAPAAGTSVAVRMLDTVDSNAYSPGRQYRASVTRAITAANGVAIAQGAAATVTLTSFGYGYSAQLSSITLNGQPVTVGSSSVTITAAAQTAAGNAVGSINSVLSPLGHHVNAPAATPAAATGQHVLLPTGTALAFVLSQPPAAGVASSTMASAAPAASTPQAAAAYSGAQPYYTLCRYQGQQGGHPVIYVTPIIHTNSGASDISTAFNKYMAATYDINKIQYGSGYCQAVSNSPDQQAYTMQQLEKQWANSKTVVTHLDWTGTPGEIAAADAKLSATAQAAAAATAGGPFLSCSTSPAPGTDIYLTGVFQTTRPIRQLPNGTHIVDPSILNDFQAFLKQKGYTFKPGNNQQCDVKPTEAAAKAAQHMRAYGGGGGLGYNCCGNGKIVETGWTE